MTVTEELATTDTTSNARAEYIAGLRAIADMLENTAVPLPAPVAVNTYYVDDDAKLVMAAARRVIGGEWEKCGTDGVFYLRRMFGPHIYDINTSRYLVCERVVVGTEQVEAPDPNAPKVVVEKEIVEWRCSPLLDDEPASGAA